LEYFYCLNIAILKKMRIKTSPIIQFNSTTNLNVRKLVVTEGHFLRLPIKNQQKILDGYAFFEKKRW
jgi:hypothetical protein